MPLAPTLGAQRPFRERWRMWALLLWRDWVTSMLKLFRVWTERLPLVFNVR
jgi:hypothetical protein